MTLSSSRRLEIDTFAQVVDVREINENNFYFTLALQMDTSWTDKRLAVYEGGRER